MAKSKKTSKELDQAFETQNTSAEQPQAAQPHADAKGQSASNRPQEFAVVTDKIAGFRLVEERQFRQVAFVFPDKPNEAVRTLLKDHDFRWNPERERWTKTASYEARIEAEQIAKEISRMARGAHGQSEGMAR